MHNKFKNGTKVFVYGFGLNDGKYYYKESAIIIERDPHYKDYLVRFKSGVEDWISPKNLRKPYTRKKGI